MYGIYLPTSIYLCTGIYALSGYIHHRTICDMCGSERHLASTGGAAGVFIGRWRLPVIVLGLCACGATTLTCKISSHEGNPLGCWGWCRHACVAWSLYVDILCVWFVHVVMRATLPMLRVHARNEIAEIDEFSEDYIRRFGADYQDTCSSKKYDLSDPSRPRKEPNRPQPARAV